MEIVWLELFSASQKHHVKTALLDTSAQRKIQSPALYAQQVHSVPLKPASAPNVLLALHQLWKAQYHLQHAWHV